MKRPNVLVLSLLTNLFLLAVFTVTRRHAATTQTISQHTITQSATPSSTSQTPIAAQASLETTVIWRQIESADYRQYIANLRDADCPEWLVRDIIVADIDDLYRFKAPITSSGIEPWQSAFAQHELARERSAKLKALAKGKRALVNVLLGYEWEDDTDEIWNQQLLTTLRDGFLPDDKAARVWELREEFQQEAFSIRESAHFILLDDDRAKLESIYQKYETALAEILDPQQLDELDLRSQQNFLAWNDVHFDGVNITTEELREFLRMTKQIKDVSRADFVPEHRVSEAEQAQRKVTIEKEAETIFGAARLADFQRAQDSDFRQISEFSREMQLPLSASVTLYHSRQNAIAAAQEIQNDAELSSGERDTALSALKTATIHAISPELGGNLQCYLAGPGNWVQNLTAQTATANP